MSATRSRRYKIVLWLLTLTCLGGAGYLGYRTFFAPASAERQLGAADAAYARGVQLYGEKQWTDAATRFDEARLLANKANDALEEQAKAGKAPADAPTIQGKIMWVKARAIRDHAYAKAQADGKPLPDVQDTQFNEPYRTYTAIADPEALKDAVTALRTAAVRLGSDPDVIKEVLRFELVLSPIQWSAAEPFLRRQLEINAKDPRANYYLARFEYEQPVENQPLDRRDADRIEKAAALLATARQNGSPHWRTIGLEAEILDWPVRTAAARKIKPDALAAAERAVDHLLFDPQSGAVIAAGRGDKLAGIGGADALGLVSVLTTGYERAAAEARKPGGSSERLKLVTRAALDLANKLTDDPALHSHLAQITLTLLQIARDAQAQLARTDPAWWTDYTAGVEALAARAPEALKNDYRFRLAHGRFLAANAASAADPARAKEFLDRAVVELDEGLQSAEKAKAPAASIEEITTELADLKLTTGARGEALEPLIARLRASANPRIKLFAQYFDAVVAEHQGRLEKCRKLLQAIAEDRTNPDLAFRANVLLANVCGASGDWTAALGALSDVEARYNAPDLPSGSRRWADERLGGLDGLLAGQVETNLNIARQIAARYSRDNPGSPIPADVLSGYEVKAEGAAKRIRPPSPADRTARLALATYAFNLKRRADADKRLEALRVDYPDSVEVLRARCLAHALPTEPGSGVNENGVAAADLIIAKFLRDYPANRAGQLFKAEWLLGTGRADEALKYLNDPASFPGGRDAAVDRLLANALLQSGQKDEAQKVRSRLPQDPFMDAVLLQAARTREGTDKQIKEALAKYENQGLFRIFDAAMRLSERKYDEAVRGFASATEFTQYAGTARLGLRYSMAGYALADPAKARDLAVKLAAEMPDEPLVYLGAAEAAVLLDDIGTPTDKWDQTRTMFAALNRWETAAQKRGTDPSELAATRADFRRAADDFIGARQEATTGLNRNPRSVRLMLLLAELSLAPPANPARAREFLDAAVKENPTHPLIPRIEGAIRTAEGNHAGAAEVYAKLVAEAPRNPGANLLLVRALEAAGKKDDALKRAREWADRIPADDLAALYVIRLLSLTGKKDEAAKVADDLASRRAGDARKQAAAAAPPLPPAEVDKIADRARGGALFTAATALTAAGAFPEAELRAREALKLVPERLDITMLLGDIAIGRKDWDAANTIYTEVLKTAPRYTRDYNVAGNNVAWIRSEIKNDPLGALALVEEVRKGRDGGRPIRAERLPPDFLDTLGSVYLRLNRADRFPEMRTTFEAATRRYPTDPRMFLYLGHALAATGERSKALEAFDEAVRLTGTDNQLPAEENKRTREAADAARQKLRK
jgi:predicted Zn-dependent protease